jgi:hypothetical protein
MKRTACLLFMVCAGFAVMFRPVPAQDEAPPTLQTKLSERRIAHRDTLLKVVDVMRKRYQDGSDTIEGLLNAQIALADAELAITSKPTKRIEKLKKNLVVLRQLEEYEKARLKVGAGREDTLLKSTRQDAFVGKSCFLRSKNANRRSDHPLTNAQSQLE